MIGTRVSAVAYLHYRLPVAHAFGWTPKNMHERLGARLSVYINSAESYYSLELARSQHEAGLLSLSKDMTETVEPVRIEYVKG